jgi:hypothetical protein
LFWTSLATALVFHLISTFSGGGLISFGIPIGRGLAVNLARALSISSDLAPLPFSVGGLFSFFGRRRRLRRPRRRLALSSSLNGHPRCRSPMNPPCERLLPHSSIDVVEVIANWPWYQCHPRSQGPGESELSAHSPYCRALGMPRPTFGDKEN